MLLGSVPQRNSRLVSAPAVRPARNSPLSIKAASVRKERTRRAGEDGEEEESSVLTAPQHQREANHT